MRIVKLSSLSEKERKKVLEEQEERYQQNQQERQRIQKQANDDFVNSFGNGDTNPSHTTTYKEILNSMQNKQQKRDFKKVNRLTLWDQIKDMAGVLENIGLGANNGIKSSQQTIGRTLSNGLRDRVELMNKTNDYLLNNATDENVKKKAQAMLDNTNSIISTQKMNENTQKAYNQIQEKKKQNSERIQENIEKQSNPALKKLAEINPSIGQMLPGMVGGPLGTTYFMTSAVGNYYDDAKQRGMNEEQANIYSSIMGIIEGATESIGAKLTTNVGKQLLRKNIKGALINYGLDIGENFLEESIVEPISELVAQTTAGKDKANWDNMKGRMIQSGIDGALTAVITGSVSGAVGNIGANIQDNIENKKANKNADYWIDKAQQIVNENTDNKVIDQENKTPQNQFSQAEKTETLRQEARNKLESIKQNYDEDSYNQMQEFIETAPSEKALNQVISDLNKEAETKQVAPLKQKQEVQLPMKQETQNKSFEDVAFEAMNNYESNEVESPLKNRDMDSIGKQTKVNAYQYDNPKVKPYFQEMAQQMGEDLAYISSSDNRSTQKGGGTKLSATTKAMDILHNEQGYSYNQIAQGLQNIIDDKGNENNAISKKIELVIDEQLRNGYTNALGKNIEPNQEYINTITEQYSLAEQPQQNNFKYEQSDNSKIDTFRQDASKYWDNSEKTSKLVNTIEKVINDKGYNIRLNDTIGDNVNGKIVTNQETGEIEITINPNSSRAGEFILGHELTHAIQTQEMVDLVNQRMQKDGDLRNAVEDLKKLYNTDEVNAEVLADISGQLFGNQEFINNLSVEKPNVFKRIYDKIISLANKITGNSSEALFIKDLKNKWEKAYRVNTNKINEAQYIETNTIKDNKGRQLSNQQQEYFKDSKVRDEKGNLLTVYHGTMGEFNIFDINKAGINYENSWSALGRGFYFTPNYDSAKEYASSGTTGKNKHIKEVYINVINPFNISKDYTQELSSLKEKYNIEDFYLKKGYRLIKFLNEKNIDSTNILQELGFDGIIEEYSGDIDQVVAFYPKQIKSIDNKTPTTNPDIRYSLNEVAKNNKKVYNIINKSITNSERNQVSSEVLTWRNNQDDGIGYIDLSAKGYKSYIYNKQENNVETLLKVNGNEDFKNYIRKGIEDGTFKNTEGLIKPIDAIKNEYRRYSNNNDLLSRRRTDNSNDKLSVGFNGEQGTDNSTENIKQSSRNESIENSEKGSFNLSKNKRFDVTGNENLDKSGTLFFRTREDGIYYVQATDHSGDLIYEGTFLDKKSLSRTLGEDIANYIVENSEKTNNEIYIENNGNTKSETDYMMRHRPSEEYGNGSNFEKNMDGVFEHPQWYMNMNEDWNVESLNALRKIRNKPDAEITIYRATPGNKINPGDWVTPSKKYAELHNNSQLDGKGNILELKVKAKDILWGGDDINEFGYYPNNEKYSKQNNNWQDYLENNYKSEGTTTDLRDIRLPMKEKQEVKLPMKQENTQQTQEQNNNTKGETINWNEIERPEENRKFRKHYKSIIESDNTTAEAKAIAKELMGTDTYTPETNKGQLAQADQRIMTSSPEVELQSLLSRAMNGEKISSVDIAVGERLIQYFSKTGNKQQLQDAIQATAMAGTSAGQTVQALSMLNHQTPQGQATWIQRSVDKMNKELAKKKGGTITTDAVGNLQVINKQGVDITDKVDLFNLTPEMIDKIMNSENQEQMYKNIDEVYEELGQQVPLGTLEKIDSWRYFSMLANARTHIRNMVGNLAMGKTQRIKDKLAGGIEDVVSKFNPKMERTKTLAFADKKTKDFAKQDFKNMEVQSRLELNENKYNPQSRLQNARRTFKSNAMENTLGRLFNLNDKLLSAEDGIGLKAGYQKALADYITANKIDVDNITDAQLNKARNYAVQQAKEATFHQANALANLVNQLGTKNKVGKFIVDATLPFKKTPMNVAKSGIEYSPVGLLKSAIFDTVNLRKGNISINQYIDNVSKGLTGSGVALVGYALAKAGILKASGSDDKDKEKYDEEQGKQSYSIEIAGKTYSLDWLSPTGIPLFIGAEINNLENQQGNEKNSEKKTTEDWKDIVGRSIANITNAGATAINPMSEMSMISGITSVLSSYNKDNALGDMATNMGKSYINQFVPTVLGQVSKTTDNYERTTKSTKTGTFEKALDQTVNQIKNKIPGLRQTLPIKTDIWGNDVKQEVNLPLRAVNNFINPATVKNVSTDKVDKELNKLYEENHSSSLLPDILTKTVQLNKQTYRLSNKEYAEFTKNYGQTSHKLIENFIKTSDYNKLTQEQKETAISNIYSYAKEQNKMDYAKKVNETVKPSTLYTTMKEIEKNGGKQSEYLSYLAKTKGMSKESEKNKVLADSNYSNKTKEIIYTNGTGKDDNLYNNLLSKSHINMTEYLDYKDKISNKVFSADKDKNGKTVTGSAKGKVINYLNNNITGVGNRLLIAGKSYALKNNEKQKLAQYINSIVNTKEERIEIYKQLDKNFYVRNGKVYMRVSK